MGLFGFLFKNRSSKKVARDRLAKVLVQDRSELPPALLNMLASELIHNISQYLDVDEASASITISRKKRGKRLLPVLEASIPLRSPVVRFTEPVQ